MTDATAAPTTSGTAVELEQRLLAKAEALRDARIATRAALAVTAALETKFVSDHAAEFSALETAKDAECVTEVEVDALALALYEARKDPANKKLVPGVSITMRKRFAVDSAKALEFAQRTKMGLVPESYDEKALLKIAGATIMPDGATKVPGITVSEHPSVSVAQDLEKALAAT